MAKSLYLATAEPKSGKSLVSLGIMEILKTDLSKVAFFRPVIQSKNSEHIDPDIHLLLKHYNLPFDYEDVYGIRLDEGLDLFSKNQKETIVDKILPKFRKLEEENDFVLIEGSDFSSTSPTFEFEINSELAKNFGSPVLIVTSGLNKTTDEIFSSINLSIESYQNSGCSIFGVIVSRVSENYLSEVKNSVLKIQNSQNLQIYFIPENELIGASTIREIRDSLNANVLYGEKYLMRHVHYSVVAAMRLENFLSYIKEGTLVIVPGDRADIILGSFVCSDNKNFPRIVGVVLTGGISPDKNILKIMEGLESHIPVIQTKEDTLRSAFQINGIDSKVSPDDKIKIVTYLALFESSVDSKALKEKIITSKSNTITPKMFEFNLIQKAKVQKKHIVLPEGEEERILKAVNFLLKRDVVKITLLGNKEKIYEKVKRLDLNLTGVEIIDPAESKKIQEYIQIYYELRKHKGITIENAKDILSDYSYYGTMMVYNGDADGMVSGSINTTQHTIRPALEFIKTKPGFNVVSSVFFMCLPDRVLVYGDCAVNPNPTDEELAEIAISSAETAKQFGIEPKVALLSYSTGESGKGEEVEKVKSALQIAKKKSPHLLIDGPIQYDAAIDLEVGKSKMPNSLVAGKATVFIFPDLNTGNNTYKAVQRSANAVAIGPVLQGLKKPVNDLSRGCTVPDIINTVAITAIQAQTL
ncbi:MAG: phosphate acetyltransferase [Leptospiraceae bacterium]|nr:phosphate acetyltransferase [Leptospiraceae bacterium]MCK6381986.1 phosphate acetyltransferase [Leptospiraceae bacterium]NUM42357.1 phosphate acetyltransferase [Leptospiraceae bacterium]